ncbi:hypothetical protein ACFFJY_14690 [Fictibacillus aquaticus]|uniref:hypothetical protein n=1 Tax=Fictibacillus aquaticus TaxID=2021314 RepID=UPI0010568F20|nr:hypothetical protein [Fictibacillus aquaticus]
MKPKHFYIAIMAAVIIWAGNYTYFEAAQLEKPVFLDHYYEMDFDSARFLAFYFITNKFDDTEIQSVELDGVEAYNYNEPDRDSQEKVVQEFQHQNLKTILVYLPSVPAEKYKNGTWQFENITVHYENGSRQTVPIGMVKINAQPRTISTKAFEFKGSGSNQQRDVLKVRIIDNLSIKEISSPFLSLENDTKIKVHHIHKQSENIQNPLRILLKTEWNKVPGKDKNDVLYPMQMKKNEWLGLYVQKGKKEMAFQKYELKIEGTTEDGENVESFMYVQFSPYLSEKDVQSIIALKSRKTK